MTKVASENPFLNVQDLYPANEADQKSLFERDDIKLPGEEDEGAGEDDKGEEEGEDDTADDADDKDDAEEGEDDGADDEAEKIQKAREKALAEVGDDDDAASKINKRFDDLEAQIKASRDGGDSKDKTEKEWFEDGVDKDGVAKTPKSWSQLIDHIEKRAVDKAVKLVADTIKQSNDSNNQRVSQLQKEAKILIDDKLIEKDELPALVEFMKKVKSPDLISAYEGYRDAREGKSHRSTKNSQRKEIANKMNRGERPSLTLKKPTYAQISTRSLDDIVDDALRGMKR